MHVHAIIGAQNYFTVYELLLVINSSRVTAFLLNLLEQCLNEFVYNECQVTASEHFTNIGRYRVPELRLNHANHHR